MTVLNFQGTELCLKVEHLVYRDFLEVLTMLLDIITNIINYLRANQAFTGNITAPDQSEVSESYLYVDIAPG